MACMLAASCQIETLPVCLSWFCAVLTAVLYCDMCCAWLALRCAPQVLSNSSVSSGVGVYWMFYSGGDCEPVAAPQGLPGAKAGAAVEGLRMRPGLAMSQVRVMHSRVGFFWGGAQPRRGWQLSRVKKQQPCCVAAHSRPSMLNHDSAALYRHERCLLPVLVGLVLP